MAIKLPGRHADPTVTNAVADAFADFPGAPAPNPAPAPKRRRRSRRGLALLSAIPVVALALGTVVSVRTGLIGSKKPSTPPPTAAQQASTILNQGLAAQQKGQIATATADYHRVLALDPQNKYAYYDLALIDQNAGRSTQAINEYRQALVIDPNLEVALFNLAILETQPDPQTAVDLYRHAITLNPRDASAHLNLGFLLSSLGQQSEGTSELNLAIGIDPTLHSRVPANMLATTPPVAPAKGAPKTTRP